MRIWAKRGRDIGTAQSKSGAPGLWSASFLVEPRQYPVGLLENRCNGSVKHSYHSYRVRTSSEQIRQHRRIEGARKKPHQ